MDVALSRFMQAIDFLAVFRENRQNLHDSNYYPGLTDFLAGPT
ncbi:hypothetical protein LJR267_009986 [Paraburkholderia hospita]